MLDVAVIDDPAAAEASLDPMRARLLAALAEPGSATTLAARAGVSRQRLNYHLRELERHGLIELVEERRKGNCTERVLRATAASYVISPAAFAAVAPDPARSPDKVSAYWMLALAGQLVRDVGELIAGAAKARKPVADLRDRQRDPLQLRRRPRGLRKGAGRGDRRSRRAVPRRRGRGRPRPPARARPAPQHHPNPRDTGAVTNGQGVRDRPRGRVARHARGGVRGRVDQRGPRVVAVPVRGRGAGRLLESAA